ncbi:hypothetical protein NJT12_14340 [Flavobacterium sp. AC]|uniref:Uncharacterized protein n=1 Tax=Flavobacterium azizsancarii TaxID=2961580 RepID=A0ABT4WFB7_9FLAO|nr:hypothetical protein [Flavobacterium azizsancarii]MDA6070794.1 hypothetical protein [Flavobacterium azizsancarii]
MSEFRHSVCEPTKPKIIEKGKIDSSEIIKTFQNFPWKLHLEEMENAKNVYHSPSLEFENSGNRNALSISAVGKPDKYEFYVFFKRAKIQKTWFGLSEKLNKNFISELTDQNEEKTTEILKALADNDLAFLEQNFQ